MAGISQRERDRRDRLYERGLKQCNTTGEPLPLEAFAPRHDGYQGREGTCRACRTTAVLAHQNRHPEKVNARMSRWAAENPERRSAIVRRYAVRLKWRQEGFV